MATAARIGLVLSGGGAFGAWETGALHAFFEWWKGTHGEEPPIRVAVGTSTGALISPFALLGRPPDHDYLAEVIELYANVKNKDIRKESEGLLSPAPFFLRHFPAVYDAGYDKDPAKAARLYKLLLSKLSPDRLAKLGALWTVDCRLGVATLDLETGKRHVVTNSPADLLILVEGVMASAMAPLALPPIPLPPSAGGDRTPHVDGGLYEEVPARTLFEVASLEPAIRLTHVVVVSSFPWFPSDDSDPIQGKPFPTTPKFGSIGDRMNALMSEANATKDTRLAWAAIELRKAGRTAAEVADITGHDITDAPELIRLFPKHRLGWQAFDFSTAEMIAMQKRGCEEASAILGATVDCSQFRPAATLARKPGPARRHMTASARPRTSPKSSRALPSGKNRQR